MWDWMGSNHRPSGYEPRALPLSYSPYKIKPTVTKTVYYGFNLFSTSVPRGRIELPTQGFSFTFVLSFLKDRTISSSFLLRSAKSGAHAGLLLGLTC